MNCEKCRDYLNDYLDDELDASTFADVEHHIGSCPDCKAELDRVSKMRDLLGDLRNVKIPEGEREAFIGALRSRIEAEGGEVVVTKRDWRPALVSAIALVAVLIVAVSLPGAKRESPVINPASGLNKVDNVFVDTVIMSAFDDYILATSGEMLADPLVTGGQAFASWKVVKDTHGDLFEPAE